MEITEFYISGFTAHACAVRSLHVWYLWRMPEMDAPRALVFRPLVKGNEALGTRLLPRNSPRRFSEGSGDEVAVREGTPCIRLERGKFELTNQDSAGGKNSSVLM